MTDVVPNERSFEALPENRASARFARLPDRGYRGAHPRPAFPRAEIARNRVTLDRHRPGLTSFSLIAGIGPQSFLAGAPVQGRPASLPLGVAEPDLADPRALHPLPQELRLESRSRHRELGAARPALGAAALLRNGLGSQDPARAAAAGRMPQLAAVQRPPAGRERSSAECLLGAAPPTRLPLCPAPDQGGQAGIVRRELVEAEQVHTAARHLGRHLRRARAWHPRSTGSGSS